MPYDTEPPLYNPNTQSYEVGPAGAFTPNYTDTPPIQMQENPGVINVQPTKPVYVQNRSPGDHFYILSVVLSTICFLCCSWYALCCTIPAIVYAVKAQDAEVRGDRESMMKNRQTAFVLNIFGFVAGLIILILHVILVVKTHQWGPMLLFLLSIFTNARDPNENPTNNY